MKTPCQPASSASAARRATTPGSARASKGGRKSPERTALAGAHACLDGVLLQALGQLLRTAQRRGVPAVDLVGGDPQALSRHAVDESSGEQAVVAAEQHPRGNGRPRRKRRRLPQPCLGLPPAPPQCLRRQLRGNVLIEERDVVLVPLVRLLEPRV